VHFIIVHEFVLIKRDIVFEKEEGVITTPNSLRRIHWQIFTVASMASKDQAFREDECLSVQAKAQPFLVNVGMCRPMDTT
jgi:hypothetical protein